MRTRVLPANGDFTDVFRKQFYIDNPKVCFHNRIDVRGEFKNKDYDDIFQFLKDRYNYDHKIHFLCFEDDLPFYEMAETKIENKKFCFFLDCGKMGFGIQISSEDKQLLFKVSTEVKKLLEKYEVNNDADTINVKFWFRGRNGATYYTRKIQCPIFDEISANYPAVEPEIKHLLGLKTPWDVGKMIFWMGAPGTGKTYCLRALLQEWRKKVTPHVIIDPEAFFKDPMYLQEVLLENETGGLMPMPSEKGPPEEKKGNLIILEDSPRTVLQEARGSHETYGMARLLNFTDGILGQGLSCMFLITTNDDIDDIDSAFLRDGRALQRLKFEKFSPEEAEAWLKKRGYNKEIEIEDEVPLSRLYAILNNKEAHVPELNRERCGF